MVIDSSPTQLKHISRFHVPRQPTKTVKACSLVYLDKATLPGLPSVLRALRQWSMFRWASSSSSYHWAVTSWMSE